MISNAEHYRGLHRKDRDLGFESYDETRKQTASAGKGSSDYCPKMASTLTHIVADSAKVEVE